MKIYRIKLDDGTLFVCNTKHKALRRVLSLHYRYKRKGTIAMYRFIDENTLPSLVYEVSFKKFIKKQFSKMLKKLSN